MLRRMCMLVQRVTNTSSHTVSYGIESRRHLSVSTGCKNVNDSCTVDSALNLTLNKDAITQETRNVNQAFVDCNPLHKADFQNLDSISPAQPQSFNIAVFANSSPVIQYLADLNVKLSKIERTPQVAEFILRSDLERDIMPYIRFLYDNGLETADLGRFLTKNPKIFQELMPNLHARINYLNTKRFTAADVSRILKCNPYWLLFSIEEIDHRLGFFQTLFDLKGYEVRELVKRRPTLITYNRWSVRVTTFVIKEELGFSDREVKQMLLECPKLWTIQIEKLKPHLDYIHNNMGITHEAIAKQPFILCSRAFRTEQRHRYLESVGRDQYDPLRENYVSLNALAEGDDTHFCLNVAKTSVEQFNTFLKTL